MFLGSNSSQNLATHSEKIPKSRRKNYAITQKKLGVFKTHYFPHGSMYLGTKINKCNGVCIIQDFVQFFC